MTARPNSAARAPSTTRWSKVSAIVADRRETISPSRTTGRSAIRPRLRIATSGWLTIGVWKSPATLPALVTVNVDPRAPPASACRRARPRPGAELRRAPRSSVSRSRGRPARRAPGPSARPAEVVAVSRTISSPSSRAFSSGNSWSDSAQALSAGKQQLQVDPAEVALLDPGHRRHSR